ncbi:MAG: hypothetical protein QY325_05725 [Flavobacteriales bacterium]|nr:MAG: hypothetical protein QY325_05725 [Flavobacteriales bacterium]
MSPVRTLPFLAMALLVFSCRKDRLFTDDPGAKLEFSQVEVLFDTVFAVSPPIGTVTKRFRVRNPNSEGVRVDIALEGGTPSPFRINVDGAAGTAFNDVEILGGDSIYVFVEASLDQSNQSAPFVHEDHIVFLTNGNEQKVKLVAWGQDAHYFYPDRFPAGLPAYSIIAGENETVQWGNDKPYLIYGYAAVDSLGTLIIDPGVRVYVHGGGGLWIYRWGRLLADGTPEEPITFQGDRLEPFYAELPGQWDRIWINDGPAGADHVLDNVLVKNALVGIQCETWPGIPDAPTSAAKLNMSNVRIRNCSAAGVLSRNFRITAGNVLIGDCGQYAMALTGGGEYDLNHITVANYWTYAVRNDPSFIVTNTYADITGTTQVRDIVNSRVRNCIITGANANEFQLAFNSLATPALTFERVLLRTDQPTNNTTFFPFQDQVFRNQAHGFRSVPDRDFHLTAGAYARGRADASGPFEDLDGVVRGADGQYDLGCFEYVP